MALSPDFAEHGNTRWPIGDLSEADTFREDTNMCTVVGMWIAGIPVADRAVLHLAASLREAELVQTAERLERAYDRESRIVALDIPDRDAILRVLEDCPEG